MRMLLLLMKLGAAAALLGAAWIVRAPFMAPDDPLRQATLAWTALTLIPIPGAIVFQLYRVGRYHQNLNLSYFVEEGTLRQLRLLIGRLPIVPLYPTFRADGREKTRSALP